MKKLNITFCSFPDYAANAKSLYEYMVKKYKNNMNYTWIVYNKETVTKLKSKNINAILIGTDEFKEYIPTTDVFFTTQGNLDGDKRKAKNSIYIELWHGIGPKAVGFAQENPSEEDIRGYGNIKEIVDYFIVPSDFWKVQYGAMFKVEFSRIKSLGMPILDYFKYSNGKENLSKVLNKDISKYKKIIIYLPTFKQGFNHTDIINISDNIFNFNNHYDEKQLDKFLKENNYLLCVKEHPGEQAKLKVLESDNIINIEEKVLNGKQISINEIINAFDLLITDYSSVGVEFIFLDKPVLYAIGDYEEYSNTRGVTFGTMDFWIAGPIGNDINSLCEEINKLLNDSNYYKDERDKYKKLWFGNTIDGGCDKICDFIFKDNQINPNLKKYKSELLDLKDNYESQRKIVEEQISTIKKLTESDIELKEIKNSKGWKLLEKIRKVIYIRKFKK